MEGNNRTSVAGTRRRLTVAAQQIRFACRTESSTDQLIDRLVDPMCEALALSGVIIGSTDPATTLMSTATRLIDLPPEMVGPWMQQEFIGHDVNRFDELHESGRGAATIHRAHAPPRCRSRRCRLNHQMGFGPELRTTFSIEGACWGILNGLRSHGQPEFGDEELAWVNELAPDIAAALRRSLMTDVVDNDRDAPAVITIDAEGVPQSSTPGTKELLAELWLPPPHRPERHPRSIPLPGEALMVTTLVQAQSEGHSLHRRARTRLRGRSGRWITIDGKLTRCAQGKPSGTVLIIEPSRPADILPLLIAAYELTTREQEVFGEISTGRTTRDIADRLFISEHTVRDHVKSIFNKTGAGSRTELMSMAFQTQHAPTDVLSTV